MYVGRALSLGQPVSCREVRLAIGQLPKMVGRCSWLFVTLGGREAQSAYFLVTKNGRCALVVLRRPPLESSIFRFAEFKRINDRSTNGRFGESAF